MRVALPSASEVTMDQTRRPPGPAPGATGIRRVRQRRHISALGLEAAIDHFSPPTPLTALKVAEYHVK